MAITANPRLVPKQITNSAQTLRLIAMRPNTPASAQWVTIEEHRRRLQEERSGLVQSESFPQAGVHGLGCSDTVAGEVTVVRGCVETGAGTADVAFAWGDEGVLA